MAVTQKMNRERDAALLSMDKQQIVAYASMVGATTILRLAQRDDETGFWAAVHKARTAIVALPMEARQESKRWLFERDLRSLDDGDVEVGA